MRMHDREFLSFHLSIYFEKHPDLNAVEKDMENLKCSKSAGHLKISVELVVVEGAVEIYLNN